MQPREAQLLQDILAAIEYIGEDTDELSYEEFTRDRRARQLVVYNFGVIGEAMNRLRRHYPSTVERLSSANQYIALRNVLIHGYDIIDYVIVWDIIRRNLPTLAIEIRRLLD
jgi:uncharacterized protein with HEPN domain